MSLVLTQTALPNVAGTLITVTNTTGAYVASYNDGGFGSAGEPNPDLAESCLMIYAEMVQDDVANIVINVESDQLLFDSEALNTAQPTFKLTYNEDGHYQITIFRIPVSTNGTTFLDTGASIAENNHVYYNGKIYKMVSSALVEVTDYSTMVGDDTIVQTTNNEFFMVKAQIKKNAKRFEYMEKRNSYVEDLDPYIKVLNQMDADIEGAYFQFNQDMRAAARDTIIKFHEKYA